MSSKTNVIISGRRYIITFVLSFIMALCLGAWYYFSYEVKTIRSEVYSELKAIANLKTLQITKWNNERFADAKAFVQNPFIVGSVENLPGFDANTLLKSEIINTLNLINANSDYSNIILSNSDGKPLLSLDPKHQQLDSITTHFIKLAEKEKKIVFTDLYRSPANDEILMDFIAPVINKNNSVTAILILRINPDTYLYPLIKEWPVPGKTSETLIVRKEKENVLYLNELNNRSRTALNLEIPFTAKKVPAVQAALGRKGIFEGISYHGTNVLSYISPVSGTPWIIIAQIDDNEIYAQLYFKEIVIISFTVLVIIILTGGLVWYFHYRQKNIYRELFVREKELREHHEEFRTILYSIGDGVITVDINGRIKNMNNTAEKLTGWNEPDAKNKLFEEVFKIINEETRNTVENPVKKVFSMGISAGLANHTILISRNGEEIPIADSAAPIHNELGEIIGVVLVFRDKIEEHKADKIIHESEARLKRAELVSKSGNWELPLDSQIMHYSEGAEKIYGISKGSLYYETIKSNALPEYRAMLDEARKNLIENNQAYNVEYKIKTADTGEIKYIHSMAEYDSKRKILLGVIRDITERKVTEDILHESEDRFRAVYNASPSAISISEIETGKLIEINEAYEKLFGFSRDEAIGKSSLELGEWVNAEDRKAVIDTILKNKIYRNLEIKFKTKNNSIIDCLLSGGIIRTKNKNFMITIVHDITDLQNAALVIKESEERFRKIFEEHSAVKLLIDFATGNIVDANKTAVEFYGWTKDELLRMNIAEINTLPAEEIKIEMEKAARRTENHFEFSHRLKNGTIRDVDIFSGKVDIGGKEYLHSIIHDITDRKLAEDALRQSEARYRQLADNAPLPVAVSSLETGRFLYINKNGFELMGLASTDDYKNYCPKDFYINPKQYDEILEVLKKEEHVSNFEVELKNLKDRHITALTSSLITTFENKPAVFITLYDITERKHSEEEIRKLYIAVEQSPVSIVITNPNGDIEYINQKFTELTGYTSEEVRNQNPRVLKSGEQTPEFYKNLWDTIIAGKQWRGNLHNKKKNGELFWESASISPVLDEKGAVTNFIALKEDITDKLITEERLQIVFDNVFDGISIFSENEDTHKRKLIDCNKRYALMAGRTREELLSLESTENLYKNLFSDTTNINRLKSLEQESAFQGYFSWIRPDGKENIIEYLGKPIIWRGKKYTIGIDRDITEQKIAERKLEKYSHELQVLNSGKDKLFSIIAHDLRSPFNSLLGLSEIIANNFESLTPEELKDYNNDIYNSLKKQFTLLENLLNWSRLETGQMNFNPEKINLFYKTENVISLLSGNAKLKDIVLFNGTYKDIIVSADSNMLNSVLQNLISNSIKFTNKGGLIKIYSEDAGDNFIQITISDNGVGMTTDQAKNLFGLTAASTFGTNNEKGTGLGLMICKDMVERHGGTIYTNSELSKGTRISFTLPKAV